MNEREPLYNTVNHLFESLFEPFLTTRTVRVDGKREKVRNLILSFLLNLGKSFRDRGKSNLPPVLDATDSDDKVKKRKPRWLSLGNRQLVSHYKTRVKKPVK